MNFSLFCFVFFFAKKSIFFTALTLLTALAALTLVINDYYFRYLQYTCCNTCSTYNTYITITQKGNSTLYTINKNRKMCIYNTGSKGCRIFSWISRELFLSAIRESKLYFSLFQWTTLVKVLKTSRDNDR